MFSLENDSSTRKIYSKYHEKINLVELKGIIPVAK